MEYTHLPVMLKECINALGVRGDGIYLDGTAGLGGHSEAIAALLTTGMLICLDKDPMALKYCAERLSPYGGRVRLIKSDFRMMGEKLDELGISEINGVMLDLGVSSLQLDMPERGFSYRYDAPLDMRMDSVSGFSAFDIVNTWERCRIKEILYEYGEERYAPLIASAITKSRPVNTTFQLVDIIKRAVPAKARHENQHPARRTFQALRIAVNDELGALEAGLDAAVSRLAPGGRIAVLTFHSLEDRIVKSKFRQLSAGCTCPPDFPECVCNKKKTVKTVGRFSPAAEEIELNPRSECAKLRVAEKI